MNGTIIVVELLSTVDNWHIICASFVIIFQHLLFGLINRTNVFPDFSSNVYGTILLYSRLIEHIFTMNGFPLIENISYFLTTCIKATMILYEAAGNTLDNCPSKLIIVKYLGLLLGKLTNILLKILQFVFTFLQMFFVVVLLFLGSQLFQIMYFLFQFDAFYSEIMQIFLDGSYFLREKV